MPRKKIKRKTKYSDEDRRKVVLEYGVTNNMIVVAKNLNMNRRTIQGWPSQAWWEPMVEEMLDAVGEKRKWQVNQICDLAHARVVKSLTEGDEKLVVDPKTKEHVIKHVMPTGKDSATMFGISFDKGRLLDNQPTTIKGDSGDMRKLMDEFRALSRSYETKNINTIEGISEEVE